MKPVDDAPQRIRDAAAVLPILGVQIANDQITTFVQVGASIVFAVYGIVAGYRKGVHSLGGRTLNRNF